MILTIRVEYLDGTSDLKECHDLAELVLDNVKSIKVIRKEDETDDSNANLKPFNIKKPHNIG